MEAENKTETKAPKPTAKSDKNKHRVSVRFQLQLKDSTDRSFPEFSYLELIGTAKRNKKSEEDLLPHDGDCDVDELRALAKKFEEKYAPKNVGKNNKRTKTDRVQDLVDVTYGYDVTDSFVDDSEAYDELVPADWTTEHGGFYINMGELNFRPMSSGDEKSDGDFKDPRKKKTPKKKIKEHKEKKLKEGKRCLSSGEKEKSSKKVRLNSEDKEKKVKSKKSLTMDAQQNSSKEVLGGNSAHQHKNNLDHTSPDMSTIKLQDPVIKLEKNNFSFPQNSASNSSASVSMDASFIEKDNDTSISGNTSASVTLPDGLPPSLILSIQKLIEAARKAGGDGKCKFFNMDVNRILLQIETDTRKLNCRARSAVYDYLALFLPCTKETLVKRAKNLFMQEQVGRLREPLLKLRHAVEAAMPEQVKHYEEVAKLAEDHGGQSQKPSSEAVTENGEKKDVSVVKVIEVDGENDKTEEATTPTDVNGPTTPVEEKGKRTIVPKRFVWKEDIRALLCDVVRIKVELYLMSKSRSTTAEEALKGFLETEVRPIWPKGWMTTRILYRESKQAHAKVTSNLILKVKKVLKKPKDDESTEMNTNQQQVKVVPAEQKDGDETKPKDDVRVTSVTLPIKTSVVEVKTSLNQINIKNHVEKEVHDPVQPQVQHEVQKSVQPQSQPLAQPHSKPPSQLNGQVRGQHSVQPLGESQSRLLIRNEVQPPVTNQIQPSVHNQARPTANIQAQTPGNIQAQPRGHSEGQSRDQTQGQPRDQSQGQLRDGSQGQSRIQSQGQPQAQSPGQPRVQLQGQPRVQSPSQPRVQSPSQPRVQSPSQPRVQLPSQPRVQSPGQPRVQLQPQVSLQNVLSFQSSNKTTANPKVTGKTILDLLENNPGRTQALPRPSENKPVINQINKPSVSLVNKPDSQLNKRDNQTNKPDGNLLSNPDVDQMKKSVMNQMNKPVMNQINKPVTNHNQPAINQINNPALNQISKAAVNNAQSAAEMTTSALASCSFQRASPQQLAQISPPRSIKPPNTLPASSPSHSSPNRTPSVSISPARQMSNVPAQFTQVNPAREKTLSSCSFMASPTLTSKANRESPPSPVSSRQNSCSYLNKVQSSPNVIYKFSGQSPNSSSENLQRPSHSNALSTNYMGLASPVKSKPQLTATSLLNSLARCSNPQNHVSSNSSLVCQSPIINPSSIQNPLQNIAKSMGSNPHNISSIIGMQNSAVQNKPMKVPGVFPAALSNYSGLQRQFPNQPVMQRNTTTKEHKEGNHAHSKYQPTYGPPFS